MADDLLAPYRKTPPAPTGRVGAEKNGDYVAFGTKDKSQRLRIRSLSAPVNSPGYNILLNIVYDVEGTNFVLVYTILEVLVQGMNLQKLVFALENGMADYIQEFDSARWQKPAEAGAAIIHSIEMRAAKGGSPKTEAEG